jgi:hypothetical protein
MSTTYTYRPLDRDKKEIRVLRLGSVVPETGESEAQIVGSIEHVSLLDKPVYNALSYVWGEAVFSPAIYVKDGQCFAITKNLEAALLHIAPTMELVSNFDAVYTVVA